MTTYSLTIFWWYPEGRKSGGDYPFEASNDAEALAYVQNALDEQVAIADQVALTGPDGGLVWENEWPIRDQQPRDMSAAASRRVTFRISSHPNTLAVLSDIAEGAALHKGNRPVSVVENGERATFIFQTDEAAAHFIRLVRVSEHLIPLPEAVPPKV